MPWCSLGSIFCITSEEPKKTYRNTLFETNSKNMQLRKYSEFDGNSKLVNLFSRCNTNNTSDDCIVTKPSYGLGKRIVVARPGLVVVKNASNVDVRTFISRHKTAIYFYLTCPVLTNTCKRFVNFPANAPCHQSPLVRQLMKIEGVASVTLAFDHIKVERKSNEPETSWTNLKPKLLATIIDFFASDLPVYIDGRSSISRDIPASCDQNEAIIDNLINTKMRPLVQDNGGDVVFQRFDSRDGSVYVTYYGTCLLNSKISSALAEMLSTFLQFYIPEVSSVKQLKGDGVQRSSSSFF